MDNTATTTTIKATPPPTSHVLETPIWMVVVRGFQILLSLVILGLAARLMHDIYLDEFGLSVAAAVITWVVVGYALITEKAPSCHAAYHIVAVISLEAFMVILWLATFAAVAARRASFKFDVVVSGCYDTGSSLNSKYCFRKRQLEKRAYLFASGKAMMSAIAGLGALVWLLFIASFVWTLVMFLRGRKEGRFPLTGTTSTDTYQMEPKVENAAPVMQQPQPQYPVQPQPTGEYQQSPISHPTPSPYQQQPAYQAPAQDQQAAYNQQYQQHQPQYQQPVHQGNELSGTPPAVTQSPPPQQHQQPYSPPQQQ